MNIPILNLKPEVDELWEDLNQAIQGVLRSTRFIMGPNGAAFEAGSAEYLGVKHSIAVNSGTDALLIGLRAAGITTGDEVITSPFTFYATAEAISQIGATPVFVDIRRETYNIDVRRIEQAITPKTKAIIPVHLFGQGAEMDDILALAKQYKLKVIEDAAQAFGGEYYGKKLGAIGDVGCFSFYPSKNLGAYGDGGLITTNGDEIAALARMLRNHGSQRSYYNEMLGYNSRLDELQAAILRVKLPRIEAWNEGRRKAAYVYNELLADISGLIIPHEDPAVKHVYHQYTIRILHGKRDQVQRHLEQQGIGTMIYYPVPLHRQPLYARNAAELPVAEESAAEVLSLPIGPTITRTIQETVVAELRKALG
ncbi:dTDP-4-amino-4,6-dideoxygalactose transaminase [Hydrogenispora ethanolica]|jgi:dTDP-4-amino-4,6-dideoxygalactose transaminase|uniref:dTDP-4-amino-4,6-dideoxygalactose transaminase n=1 Tax=Hydrogenispora ethanolica TaxID=1082276 RepID=A0A4R1RWM9_HYDET|nr:DegT/DnrJ/EryC1/StrS family aminotransferase [Hydrogenispora ethanolica]TCL70899.1 dTDP-4-amino-4,6-dideoxygalactose transaminase [Hydrogenispora ethanolica]